MANDRRYLNEVLQDDFGSFIHRTFQTVVPGAPYMPNWHIRAIAWYLTQCYHRNIKRLIINQPPRSLKSICGSVAYPAWALGLDPTLKIICPSYSEGLAIKLARDCRAVMQSPWYAQAFPRSRISPGKNTELEFETTAGGFRYATSVGGTLTGRGGNFIIIDDPMKPEEAMSETRREAVKQRFEGTLYSRLDDKAEDVIVVIMQRLHMGDLAGCLLQKGSWTHLNLPAIAEAPQRIQIGEGSFQERAVGDLLHPERESRETLDQIKANLGTYCFSAQYQQNPIPPEGNLIRWGWFRRYAVRPERLPNDLIVLSWDTASKAEELSNYSVCSAWLRRGKDHYLLDVRRERLEYPFLKRLVVELARRHGADAVLIEDKSSGTQLIQDLRHEREVRPIAILPERDKVTRMSTQSAKIESGCVYLPEQAPWLEEFQREVLQFPDGGYDDQVDSMSQYLAWRPAQGPRIGFVRV